MKESLERLANYPHIYTKNNITYKVSKSFLQLTGYKDGDLIGKSLFDVGILLKSEQAIEAIKNNDYLYIFNSGSLPSEVKVSFDILNNENHKVYYFEKKEDSALQFILENFGGADTTKNGSVAIFSYPAGILLKHDKNYLHTSRNIYQI